MQAVAVDAILSKYRPVPTVSSQYLSVSSVGLNCVVNVRGAQTEQRVLTPNVFYGDLCSTPSHSLVTNVIKSIQAGNGSPESWGDKSEKPVYSEQWEGGSARMTIRFSGSESPEDLWANVAQMDDLTVDVFIICLTQWLNVAKTSEESVWVEINKILAYRGIQPKRKGGYSAGYRNTDRAQIVECLELLDRMFFIATGISVYRRGGRSSNVYVESKVLAITDRIREGDEIVAIKLKPGEYGTYLYESGGRQTALLCRRILEYDYYRNQWEKRIGLYLTFQWAIRKSHGTLNQPFKVGTLMANIHQEINVRYPQRTRTRLEQAFSRLVDDGVIAGWRYERGDGENLSNRGWLADWLNWTVRFDVPAAIAEQYEIVRQHRLEIMSRHHRGNAS